MNKEMELGTLKFKLSEEGNNIRINFPGGEAILENQRIGKVSELLGHNFRVVKEHYLSMIQNEIENFDLADIDKISLEIVIYYLYMYNSWKNHYEKEKDRDLKFDPRDLNNPPAADAIFRYYKKKYPKQWKNKSAVLLGMTLKELDEYYRGRERYYNK
ncbi:hypothetical protein SAMN05660909_00784 [Chitinophaga terrae (ex Kim and Jung 2007)]|uniref:Uncharacterized protein n=1 Tax=Chitinophaga terrae (ex Kim and Jung 2007) TaxID=408074 RepID=A0A1H3YAE0_9BACT|nr:hypothetical protein [Chitinophaga terrae (ex Kim and Jung 2007)]MDQ0107919.1 hypothetical protein [Chitinophaga terrae (ex Kim and Jung 2007)]GEP90848.1 hypothetical protein CTE07_24930 [Chitinophaga terrae (ex Kim and Jung 2007)]SEA08625.1 hypothetical protein SAMN05660909_00784 [Chitinophaga terrae (ex Kim and Jung 2007)]